MQINEDEAFDDELFLKKPCQNQPSQQQPKIETIKTFFKWVSVGKYSPKLYSLSDGEDASVIGGILTIISALLVILFAIITLKGIFLKQDYYLEQRFREIQIFSQKESGDKKFIPCGYECQNFTLKEIATALFNETFVVVFLPKYQNLQLDDKIQQQMRDCSNLKVSISLLYQEITKLDSQYFGFPHFACAFILQNFLSYQNENKNLWNSNYVLQDQSKSDDLFVLQVIIKNIPAGSKFKKFQDLSATVNNEGLYYGIAQSLYCEPGGVLEDYQSIIQYSVKDTIWQKEFIKPSVKIAATNLNSYCHQDILSSDSAIIEFYIKSQYDKVLRYPVSVSEGLSQIGGILSLLGVGKILSMYHEKRYEKRLIQDLQQKAKLYNLDMHYVKSKVSINNFILLLERVEAIENKLEKNSGINQIQ